MKNLPVAAILYDFDKTLSPKDMQEYSVIEELGVAPEKFWGEANRLAKENRMDGNLAWMYEMILQLRSQRKSTKKEYFRECGKKVELFKGVESWFERINAFGAEHGLKIKHYIISSGLKEIIEGSAIAKYFDRIYASAFLYTADGVTEWPAQSVNYTNKTQFIFRIAKGRFEEWDNSVNDPVDEDDLAVRYTNMIYIGDSATDIPCMRLVKSRGGFSVGVYDGEKNLKKNVYELFDSGRINFFAPAGFREGSERDSVVKKVLTFISAQEQLRRVGAENKALAAEYKRYSAAKTALENERGAGEVLKKLKQKVKGDVE